MKYFFAFLICAAMTVAPSSHAQIIDHVETDFMHFLNTGGAMAGSFAGFSGETGLKLAGSAALIGAAYSLDYNAHNLAMRNRSNFNNDLFSVDKVFGSGYTLIGISALYGYGLFFNDPGVRNLGLQTIESVGYAGLITSVLKAVVGRSRPYANEGKGRFRPFNVHAAYTSFPSGHSTVAFAVSTVLAKNTDNIYLKILCYSASTLVACSRIYHNAHWLSDVVTGGAIGYFVGDFVASHNTEDNSYGSGLSFSITPTSVGVLFQF